MSELIWAPIDSIKVINNWAEVQLYSRFFNYDGYHHWQVPNYQDLSLHINTLIITKQLTNKIELDKSYNIRIISNYWTTFPKDRRRPNPALLLLVRYN